jgi:hypothetical protein
VRVDAALEPGLSRGLPGMLLGSAALHCVAHGQCPVAVVHS